MITSFLRTSGLEQLEAHSVILVIMGVSAFCAGLGWLANWVSQAGSTGVGGNAFILLSSMAGGLVGYNHFIMPLQKSQGSLVVMVAVGAAVAGLLLVNLLRSHPFRA